jgi:hypothetical protein
VFTAQYVLYVLNMIQVIFSHWKVKTENFDTNFILSTEEKFKKYILLLRLLSLGIYLFNMA